MHMCMCVHTCRNKHTATGNNGMKNSKRGPWHAPLVHPIARAEKKRSRRRRRRRRGMERDTHRQIDRREGRGDKDKGRENERENAYKTEENKTMKKQRKRSVFLKKEIPESMTGGEEIRVRKGKEQPASKRGLPKGLPSTTQSKGPPRPGTGTEREGGETCALA